MICLYQSAEYNNVLFGCIALLNLYLLIDNNCYKNKHKLTYEVLLVTIKKTLDSGQKKNG